LRGWRPEGHAGSSPAFRTTNRKAGRRGWERRGRHFSFRGIVKKDLTFSFLRDIFSKDLSLMRKPFIVISLLVVTLWASLALAGAILNSFSAARNASGDVVVNWATGDETDLMQFEVQRLAGVQGDYMTLAIVPPKGSNSAYEFVDKSAYKTTDAIYKYRIAIISNHGITGYSEELTVSGLSGVRRTWGSIKAMFR
jgi:hypothetical protein